MESYVGAARPPILKCVVGCHRLRTQDSIRHADLRCTAIQSLVWALWPDDHDDES